MKRLLLLSFASLAFASCSVEDDSYLIQNESLDLNAVPQDNDCMANAGADNAAAFENSYLDQEVDDIGDVKRIFLDLLDEGVDRNGSFNPSILDVYQQYKRNNFRDFTTTYTVSEGECTDSANLTITVCENIPNSGADNSATYSKTYIDEQVDDLGDIKNIYLNLLDEGVSQDGTFSPSIYDVYIMFKRNPLGDFTTTYTLGEGKCIDSAELTLTIIEEQDAPCVISAGPDNSTSYTLAYVDNRIDDFGQIKNLYFELLETGVATNGTFSPDMQALYRQFRKSPYGDFKTTYTIGEGDCKDSVNLILTITQ